MAINWAICVGINNYDNMPNLRYAQRDAELMRDYFLNEAGFEKENVYLFTDNSPQINDAGKPFNSQPTYGTLKRFLRERFNKKFLSAGDNFWFFYSGHGMRFKDRDYLMPADADPHPDGVEDTAISLYFVTERLRRCGADNVILFLDACRSEENSKGLGIGKEKQKGVITFFSCSPNEKSYEIEDKKIQQGSFTYALLESLRIKGEGNCATVERLYNRLRHQVPGINHQFGKSRQTPYAIVEPATKYHLILLENQANLTDISTLKNDAYRTEVEKNFELARQLWIRVNIAASGSDMEAIEAIGRLSNSKSGDNKSSNDQGDKSPATKVKVIEENKFTPNTFKLNRYVLKGIIGVGVGVSVIGLFIGVPYISNLLIPDPTSTSETPPTSNINSKCSTLENLLKQKKWNEADMETARCMLKVADREKEGSLDREDIENFPCTDLRTIDRLWVKYSDGKFGFSVQKKIYHSLGGTKEYDWRVWKNFGNQVGWMQGDDELIKRDELTWEKDTSSHVEGHFPHRDFFLQGPGRRVSSVSQKLVDCNI
ncbi:GUN4 domain-containing protein [Okeania sp. SIO3I5]|uniref:GUN4 domain-containing protein n=1 Tax=Okeania sp. SIO3I5 TaxID=2607805 RepID=UPI0025D57890|nr:GUN4 domain-containing protein [Okeania sp. SIO3I5]